MVLAGAHNALSARLVEEAGFDAVWASGFEISASFGVPDGNVLTLSENLAVARSMAAAVEIPVIADCDSGYGNVINVQRTVREYEAAGVAGICLEDNPFPKRCSFYPDPRRKLASLEEHANRLRAAVEARRSDDFVLIGRTEALIVGAGGEEALRRARAYDDAGADLCLVHSKSESPEEVLAVAAAWDRETPLVCVPTTYKETTVAELSDGGYQVVIFANHGLRAGIRAMRETLATLRREGFAASVDARIASLTEVFELVGVAEMVAEERRFAGVEGEPVLPLPEEPVSSLLFEAG